MNKTVDKKTLFIITAFICLLISGAISMLVLKEYGLKNSSEPVSSQILLDEIVREVPALTDKGRPVIEISSVARVDTSWYIATIKSTENNDMKVPVKMVLHDQGGADRKVKVIAGPNVYFAEPAQERLALPDSVIAELQKQ